MNYQVMVLGQGCTFVACVFNHVFIQGRDEYLLQLFPYLGQSFQFVKCLTKASI